MLALSEGGDWGWTSAATLGCLLLSVVGVVLFVVVEKRVAAPLVDLNLLRNQVLVGATLAILIVAGTINALMYVLSLYFQDPAGFGMQRTRDRCGDATRGGGDHRDHAVHHAPRRPNRDTAGDRSLDSAAPRSGSGASAFVQSSWTYAAFVVPLVVLSAGLGLANGPASSASTAAVSEDQVGQASGISNMARYIGGSLAVAAVATVFNSVTVDHAAAGASPSNALAAGLSRASLLLAVCSGLGIAIAFLMARHHQPSAKPINRAAAAAASSHTIPTRPVTT